MFAVSTEVVAGSTVEVAARDLAELSRASAREPTGADEPASVASADWVESGAAGSAEATAVEIADPAPATIPAIATLRHICLTAFMNVTVAPVSGLSSPYRR